MNEKTQSKIASVVFATTLALGASSSSVKAYPIDCAILLCLAGGFPASAECSAAKAEFIRRITPFPIEPPLQVWRCPLGVSYKHEQDQPSSERLFDVLIHRKSSTKQSPIKRTPAVVVRPVSLAGPTNLPQAKLDVRQEGQSGFAGEALMPLLTQQISSSVVDVGISGARPAPLHLSRTIRKLLSRIENNTAAGMTGLQLTAGISLSDPTYSFIKSLKVFDVTAVQRQSNGDDSDCRRGSTVRVGSYATDGSFSWTVTPLRLKTSGYDLLDSGTTVPTAYKGLDGWGDLNCPTVRSRAVFIEWRDYLGSYGHEQVNY